jgi:hypothetical protein
MTGDDEFGELHLNLPSPPPTVLVHYPNGSALEQWLFSLDWIDLNKTDLTAYYTKAPQ